MGVEVDAFKNLTGGWSMAAKRCDSCKTAAAAVFCRADAAFLCLNCDTKIHGANKQLLRHERVWMCEVCEQAPAAVTCKADAAALCVSCDDDIHSANPLARRHERVPVEPFYEVAESILKAQSPLNGLIRFENGGSGLDDHEVDDCMVSWLLPSNQDVNSKLGMDSCDMKSGGDLFFPEMDQFLEFEYQNPMDGKFNQHHHQQQQQQQQNYSAGADSVVPVQTTKEAAAAATAAPIPVFRNDNCFDIDFSRSKLSSFSYPTHSLSQSVSSSSLEVGVVPDGSSVSDISYPFGRTMTSNTDLSAPISASAAASQAANQVGGMDREARVLRYREKRKNRKFEKTIRYASRKAYAETRPRIKGRFAKRTETESEMERLYNSSSITFMADNQYGVVPSF